MNELEAELMELLKTYEECANLSSAIDTVGNSYRPTEQVSGLAIHSKFFLPNSWFFIHSRISWLEILLTPIQFSLINLSCSWLILRAC